MYRKLFLLALASTLFFAACKKSTTNNYYINTTPAFTVTGLSDITMYRGNTLTIPITVQYQDSAQQQVSISISGVPTGFSQAPPNGVTLVKGIPTFTYGLYFYDNYFKVLPGTYPLTLSATGSVSGTKTYQFNLIVQ